MQPSQFTLQLGMIFMPGIIAALLVELLTEHPPWTPFRLALYAFVLGVTCHVVWAIANATFDWRWPPEAAFLDFFAAASTSSRQSQLPYKMIVGASLIAPTLAVLLTMASNKKWLFRAARWGRLTNKHGDLDLWAYAFNSRELPGWIVIRDLPNDLAYQGWLVGFSDSTSPNELLLIDVKVVRNSTGDVLYPLRALYWARSRDDATVEFLEQASTSQSTTSGNAEEGNDVRRQRGAQAPDSTAH